MLPHALIEGVVEGCNCEEDDSECEDHTAASVVVGATPNVEVYLLTEHVQVQELAVAFVVWRRSPLLAHWHFL